MCGRINTVQGWLGQSNAPCRLVVTPNVDHAAMLQKNELFQVVYGDAALELPMAFYWSSHRSCWANRCQIK